MKPSHAIIAHKALDERPIAKYVFAAAFMVAGLAFQWLLHPIISVAIFIILYPVTFLTAWSAGFKPALLSIALAIAGAFYLYVGSPPGKADLVRIAIFLVGSTIVSWIVARGKKAETERKNLLIETQTALKVRDEFISIASHELKTPLTALKLQHGLAQKMFAYPDVSKLPFERALQLLADGNRQLDRLNQLIEDLLDVSRIQSGRLSYRFNPVDVSEVVGDVVRRCMPQLTNAQCQIDLKLTPGLVANWDRGRIEQIVWNYISNVIRYAPGSKVAVRTAADGECARIEVQDKGPGIAQDAQQLIFERFERGAANPTIAGLGLGLFIVKNIAEGHGGKAWVESEPGQGSTFIAELPLAPPPAPPAQTPHVSV